GQPRKRNAKARAMDSSRIEQPFQSKPDRKLMRIDHGIDRLDRVGAAGKTLATRGRDDFAARGRGIRAAAADAAICTRTSIQRVIPGSAIERIVACPAIERVVADTTEE